MIQSLRDGLRQSGAPLSRWGFYAGLKPGSNPNSNGKNNSKNKINCGGPSLRSG